MMGLGGVTFKNEVDEFMECEGKKIRSEIIEILLSNNLTSGKACVILSEVLSEIQNEAYKV